MDSTLLLLGGVGSIIPEAVRLIKGMHDSDVPTYLKSANFFIGLVLLIVLGVGATWLGGAADIKQALAYGYGAPELVTKILGNPRALRNVGQAPSLRQWWAR